MDKTLIQVASSLYRMAIGIAPEEAEREAMESYFRRFTRFSSGSMAAIVAGEWIEQFRVSGQAQSLFEQWGHAFESQQGVDEATAQRFIRDFLQSSRQIHKLSSAVGTQIVCGETVTDKNSLLDYSTRHEPGGDQWILHLTTEGQCLLSGDQQRLLGPDQLLLLPPDYLCEYQRAPVCSRWVHRWVRFVPSPEWLNWSAALRSPEQLLVKSFNGNSLQAVHQAFDDLLTMSQRDDESARRLMKNRIEYLLLLATDSEQDQHNTLDKRLQKAMAYMLARYSEDWSVEELARHCNLSTTRFAALFKQQLGVSPMQWRDQLRIREAGRLLLADKAPIARVSEAVGYGDQLHFSRRFKQLVGVSPRQYRQRGLGV